MDAQVPAHFATTLKSLGLLSVARDQNPPPYFVPHGEYALASNTALCRRLCNTVAEQTGAFWTFTAYTRLQNTPQIAPLEPKADDPSFWPAKNAALPADLLAQHGPTVTRKLVAAHNYNQAHNAYETARKKYQKLHLQILDIRQNLGFDDRGYVAFVLKALRVDFPAFVENFFFTPTTLYVNEEERKKHTFICAGSGSGKSEAAKTLLHHYATKNTEPALVVLDPHRKMADEIARFKAINDQNRLVYISPGQYKDRHVSFNPFDFGSKDEMGLDQAQEQFVTALAQIMGKDFTDTQEALLFPIMGVLFHRDGSDFRDLVRFMDDTRNSDLVAYGRNHLPNEIDRDFFKHNFHLENFDSSKKALGYRLNKAIRSPVVREFLCNPTTVDLPAEIEAGKVIVFSFHQKDQGQVAVEFIGQLVTAFLVSYVMRRPDRSRPIHLFADECHYFVSPAIERIMGETRKYDLYATLITQGLEQLGRPLESALTRNCKNYLIGRSPGQTSDKVAKLIPDLSSEDVQALPDLTFYQVQLDRPPVKTKISYVGHRHGLDAENWRAVQQRQRDAYYWPKDAPAPENEQALERRSDSLTAANQTRQHHPPTGRRPAVPSGPLDQKEI